MNKDKKTAEENIIKLIEEDSLTKEESLDLIEELYWADWDILREKYPGYIDKIFLYLKKDDLSDKVISQILKLYNNPHGAYIREFSDIIIDLYKKDKLRFIRSLNIEKEESSNLVYLFRNNFIEIDKDLKLAEILKSEDLSKEEKDTGETLLKLYKHACST